MPMNYLTYIRSREDRMAGVPRFLVSGTDPRVCRTVTANLVRQMYERGRVLFVANHTLARLTPEVAAPFRIVDALDGSVSLCRDLLETDSLEQISRLRSLLCSLGFDGKRAMQVVTYLQFVRQTEQFLGHSGELSDAVLQSYNGSLLVSWKLDRLVNEGKLSKDNRAYLLGRYAEVSAAAADFSNALLLLTPFLDGIIPEAGMAVHLPLGTFREDPDMQRMLCRLVCSCLRQHTDAAVLILDDGCADRSCLMELIRNAPAEAEIHLISRDIFGLPEEELGTVMNTFSPRIYSRHESMASAGKVEQACGEIELVRYSKTTTVDHRLRGNSAWDLLLGTNRSESCTANAPVRDYRYHKEWVQTMPAGTAIVDCGGSQAVFSI